MQITFLCDQFFGTCIFLTHLSLSDTETVDNSSTCLFLETELEFEEPTSNNGDVVDIKFMMDDYLIGDVYPILECSCFALLSLCKTDRTF